VSGWSGRRALVTGAGGFIGSHVVEELVRRGADVRAFVRYTSRGDHGWLEDLAPDVRASVDVYAGDLANPEAVAAATDGAAAILHLGALIPIPYSFRHPREFVAANVEGTLNVLEAARRAGVGRMVHTSTSEVYGSAQRVPMDESHPLHPQSPYAATKVAADQLVLSYVRSFELPAVVARPFNTYGPRQSARAIVPTLATQALARDVVRVGATSPTRDLTFVTDTAAGIVRCAEADGVVGEVVNLGSGTEVTIGDLAVKVLEAVGRDVALETDPARMRPAAAEVDRLLADAAKAGSLLGWQPAVPLEDGLRRTVEWLRAHLDRYRPDDYAV
jgi:NAD dependent epimerase/dehydratase